MESLHCSKTTRADSKGAVESLTIGHDNRLRALSQLCLPATETPNWRASESRNAPAAIPPFFSLSLPLSPSHTLSLSLSLSHTHTHTHTHTYTHCLSFSHTHSLVGDKPATETANWRASESRNAPAAIPACAHKKIRGTRQVTSHPPAVVV